MYDKLAKNSHARKGKKGESELVGEKREVIDGRRGEEEKETEKEKVCVRLSFVDPG